MRNISGPLLVGAISASLLQINLLDEDFPAINPVKKSQSKDMMLKFLLSENIAVDGDKTAKMRSFVDYVHTLRGFQEYSMQDQRI